VPPPPDQALPFGRKVPHGPAGAAADSVETITPFQAAAARAPAAPVGGSDQLLRAFLEGAGLDPATLAGEDPVATMRRLGGIFRETVGGIREILSTRAMMKAGYRVEQTMIGAANNNPLKFVPDPVEAVAALLAPRRGYMPGERAVSEALEDIKVHELALMSAMQAAVLALLAEFEPERLKRHFETSSILDNLLPVARKARYWEIFEQEYRKIASEVGEDVRGVFHSAFAQAYQKQSRKN
jgi:type VI secretion system FHA domain protein